MDSETRDAYNARAAAFAVEYELLTPTRLYDVMMSFFHPAGLCLDVGSGSGRDVAWMNGVGFKALGIDASENLLEEAQKLHPGIEFRYGTLPGLETVNSSSVDNILCSGVLMHLLEDEILSSCSHLLRVLKDSGTIVLSFRGSRNPSASRENDGRLFTPIEPRKLILLFESLGTQLIHREESLDGRKVLWHTLVLRKGDSDKRGLVCSSNFLKNHE